jgi:hypothetical protein
MIALAGHGKDPRLVQPSIIPEFQIGDWVYGKSITMSFCEQTVMIAGQIDNFYPSVYKHEYKKYACVYTGEQPNVVCVPDLIKIGDRIKDKDEFIGVITSINPRCITAKSDESIKSYNLEELKDPNFIKLCPLHISISSEELELSPKPVNVQVKSAPSPIATSTKRRNKSTATTSQSLASIPTSENITHPKESISIQEDSPVLELPTLETSKDSITQNQPCGLNFSESSMKDSPNLSSLKIPPQSLITDYEQYLADSEWLDIVGTIHKSYKLLSLEAPKKEKDCLSLPTLTTGQGSGRNAGQTRLEKALKDRGFRADTQALSAEGMSVLFGFPPNWAKSICSNPKESPTETMQDGYSGEQSISTAHQLSSNESSILTEFSANSIDAKLQFLLEQRDRLINSGASPQGVWLSVGQVYKKDFRQVVWKSAKEHEWLGGNKSRYIGKENSDEHLSAIAQHKAGQELRKIEREIKKLQVKS